MSPLSNLDDLDAAWAVFLEEKTAGGKPTQAGAWRRDNPGEWSKLRAYRAGTGARPALATATGRQMVEEVDAYLKAKGSPPPPPPPPPPPSTATVSPFAYYNIEGGSASLLWPTSHINEYKILVGPSGGTQDATAPGKGLVYVNPYANTQHGLMGMTYQEANSNGWILSDASGLLNRSGYPNAYLTLQGNAAFCLKWCQNVLALYPNADGFMVDDINAFIPAVTNPVGRIPSQYPSEAASIAAIVFFCTFVHDFFTVQRGKYVLWNAGNYKPGDGASDTGARTYAFYQQTPGNFTSESWLVIGNSTVRRAGSGWDQNWDGWRTLHQLCVQKGVDFVPFHEAAGRQYGMCSFLLDWDGVHGAFAYSSNRTTDYDPWTSFEDQAKALGLPTGPATKTGNVWRRNFAGGYVLVDPTLGTASITADLMGVG